MKRRDFIRISGLSGGGLLLSTLLPSGKLLAESLNGPWQPNLFIRITPDNIVTVISTQMEIGQGTSTGLGQLVADELGANWETLQIEMNKGNAEKYGEWTGSGGSNGLAENWVPLRQAAASVREVLIQAAAKKWNIASEECFTEDGYVKQKGSSNQISFGDLTEAASGLPLPKDPPFRPKSEYKVIGKSVVGPKQTKIVAGTSTYSVDVKLPDMVYASIARAPIYDGKVKSFDATETKKVKGVIDVIQHDGIGSVRGNRFLGDVRAGVTVIANSTWAAIQGRKKLKVDWELSGLSNISSEKFEAGLNDPMTRATERHTVQGKPEDYFENEKSGNAFSYLNGLQANACMEPLNAVAHHQGNKLEVWVGTQAPNMLQRRLASHFELDEKNITINAQPAGGGFGRRYFLDYVEEAVLISKAIQRPVKMMWTREDTVIHNKYHIASLEHWQGKLNDNQKIIAADYRGHIGGHSAYRPWPYDIPNFGMTRINRPRDIVQHTSWRSVGAHPWIWGMETFMDEMASQANVDPLQFRLNHLNENKVVDWKTGGHRENLYPGRLKKTLQVVADKANWGRKMKNGTGQGIAGCCYNVSYCALVADVTVKKGEFTVDKIVASIDCGVAINPSQVKAQVEGSIIWGLTALYSEITIENGEVQQSNFHDYPMLRMKETPEIEVHIIENEFAPSGTGEPAVPVTAPAVLNAIFAATGKRIRRIPVDQRELS